MRRALLALPLVLLAVGCASSPLPDGDDVVDRGLREVWTTFQDGVRAADAGALEALVDPDPTRDYGADDAPRAILDLVALDADLRDAILSTRAQDLRQEEEDLFAFVYEVSGSDDEGNTYESGVYVYFRTTDEGRAYLSGMLAAG